MTMHMYYNGRRLTADNYQELVPESLWPRNKSGSPKKRPGAKDYIAMGGVRGVTDILKAIGGPKVEGLIYWSGNLAIQAMLDVMQDEPREIGELQVAGTARWNELRNEASDRGTEIHDGIERWERGIESDDPVIRAACANVDEFLKTKGLEGGSREYCFTAKAVSMGFGGTVDYALADQRTILDYKTVQDTPGKKIRKPYPTEVAQVASYGIGMWDFDYADGIDDEALRVRMNRAANVYIRQSDGGIADIRWWTPEELWRGWQLFKLAYAVTSLLDEGVIA